MFKGKGRCASNGIAFGPIFEIKEQTKTKEKIIYDKVQELNKFKQAVTTATEELEELYNKTKDELGEEAADIIQMQQMLLSDPDIYDAIKEQINNDLMALEAIDKVINFQVEEFLKLDDPYMKARSADIKDIGKRLYRIVSGQSKLTIEKPSILVSDDLTPSQTIELDKSKILGILLRHGSINAHAAILARTMDIPLLINANLPDENLNNRNLLIDATTECFYLDADETFYKDLMAKSDYLQEKERLKCIKGKEAITKAGRKVIVAANIGAPDDVENALLNDAEAIGLFRSEFLYLGRNDYPSEDEQFASYASVARAMNGKSVIIRTMDIGADKKVDYFNLPAEQNPALGNRALRICLKNPKMFKTQIRAIYRAAFFGKVLMMFPMVASVWEVKKAKEICAQVEEELIKEQVQFKRPSIGIMIETPAAAIISDSLAKEVDFFSVGTNDLTQYTLAIDRQSENLDEFYDAKHPAILELLAIIAKNAHKNGIWAGICGQLAADLSLTDTFIQMGYDELSVPANCVLKLKEQIINSNANTTLE